MLLRDRNHPSVITWSLCNEALCQYFDEAKAAVLKPIVTALDPTRPVAAAVNFASAAQPFTSLLGLMGFNYNTYRYDDWHKQYPTQPMIASESAAAYSDRWVYETVQGRAFNSYDVDNHADWGNSAEDGWDAVASREYVAGSFVWSGYGYKGEPDPFDWPSINTHFSILDEAGFAKDIFSYYQMHWREQQPDAADGIGHGYGHGHGSAPSATPTYAAHLMPQHWNWGAGRAVDCWAWSTAHEVELVLNGKVVGKRTQMPPRRHVAWPKVPFARGELVLNAFDKDGNLVANDTVRTTGAATALEVELEQGQGGLAADGDDVAMVKVKVVDATGALVRTASTPDVTFAVEGPGKLIGVGNGNPSSHEPDKATRRAAFNGLVRAIVQATTKAGVITLTVSSATLGSTVRLRIPVHAV